MKFPIHPVSGAKQKARIPVRPLIAISIFLALLLIATIVGRGAPTGFLAATAAPDVIPAEPGHTARADTLQLTFTPDAFERNVQRNQKVSFKLEITNTGTLFTPVHFAAKGPLADAMQLPDSIALSANTTKRVTVFLTATETGTQRASLLLDTGYRTYAIPITLFVSTTGGGSGGGGSQFPVDAPLPTVFSTPELTITILETLDLTNAPTVNITLHNPTSSAIPITILLNTSPRILPQIQTLAADTRVIAPHKTKTFELNLTLRDTQCLSEQATLQIQTPEKIITKFIHLHAHGQYSNGTLLFNRTRFGSKSFALLPIPEARLFSEPACATAETNMTGQYRIYHAPNSTLYTTAPGFVTEQVSAQVEFLRLAKAKIALESYERLTLGKTSNVTLALYVSAQERAPTEFRGLENVRVRAKLVKKFKEEEYAVSKTFEARANFPEGTTYYTFPIELLNDVPGRDLDGPTLKIQILSSTHDPLDTEEKNVNAGFLHATNANTSITLHNPTRRALSIHISSPIPGFTFTPDFLTLPAEQTQSVHLTPPIHQGTLTTSLRVAATLPAVSGWDDSAADLVELTYMHEAPQHDLTLTPQFPLAILPNEPLTFRLSNAGNYTETSTLLMLLNGSHYAEQNLTLTPGEQQIISLPTPPLGAHALSATLVLDADVYPADNSYTTPLLVTQTRDPKNLLLIILDGGGAQYITRERTPFLSTLPGRGFSVQNARVRVPSTTESHSILYTGQYNSTYDWSAFMYSVSFPNNSFFDAARTANYTLLGVLGQGDATDAIEKFDAILHDKDNGWDDFSSDLNVSHPNHVAAEVLNTLTEYNNLTAYQGTRGQPYIEYNQWTADALTETLRTLSNLSHPFLLASNFPGTDHGGHEGAEVTYFETYTATDAMLASLAQTLVETGLANSTVLLITADHGMCFRETSYGRIGYHSKCTDDVAQNIPFLMTGPNTPVQSTPGPHTNDQFLPTLAKFLNLPSWNNAAPVIQALFQPTQELRLTAIEAPPARVGENLSVTIHLENTGTLPAENTLCLTTTNQNDSYSRCSSLLIETRTTQIQTYYIPINASGIYTLTATLQNEDDSLHGKQLELKRAAGLYSDLAVTRVQPEKEPGKLKAKVTLENQGHFDLENLTLECIRTALSTGEITQHMYENKAVPAGSTRSFGPWSCGSSAATRGLHQIQFRALLEDADGTNNIKTLVTFVP